MNIPWEEFRVMAELGALGGLVQCVMRGIRFPYRDPNTKAFQLGSIGTIFVGSVAAVVVWSIYGPFASFDTGDNKAFVPHIPGLQLGFSVLVGFSGGEILKLEAQKRLFGTEKEEMSKAKNELVSILQDMLKEQEGSQDDTEGETENNKLA